MSLRSVRLLSLTVCLFALATLVSVNISAQQPKVLAPHKPVAPTVTPLPNWHFRAPTQRSMVGGFWMIDANFRSTLYLKNGLKNAGIKVTPIVYLSNGKGYTLSDVPLDPSGTAVVNINSELAKQGIASWATLSGYVEIRYNHAWDAICVTLQDVDVAHSLIFTYRLQPAPSSVAQPQTPAVATQETQTVEGMWWKRESNVAGFVALSNVLAQPVRANVVVSDNQGKPMKQHTVTISPHGTKLVKLDELLSPPNAEGGITVAYQGPKDGLLINGGLEDPSNGYSATLRFYPALALQSQPPTQAYAELGLMAGAADPMMAFPAGTVFTPYSLVRNVTAQPIEIIPVLWWMEAGAPRSARLARFALPPYSTQKLPVESLLAQAGLKNFNGSFNLILEAGLQTGGLLMASGSVDLSNTYVFEVLPQGAGESASKSISYWSTGKGDDTMITIWNPADEAQDFVFTLFFSGGSYKYPLPLGPRETRTFNVSEIIHSQIPDAHGNVVPIGVHEGSAEISGSRGETEQIMVGIAAGIYNVQKATCGNPCNTCNGITYTELELETFGVKVGGTTTESLIATFNTGSQQNYSSEATWSSYDTSILTLSNPGTAKGVSPGSSYAHAITAEEFAAYDSCITSGQCPDELVAATAPGTVASLSCTSSVTRGGSATCTVTPSSGITVSGWQFKDGSGKTVTRTASPGSLTWSGMLVTGGTVSVNATVSGASTPLSASTTVTARSGLAFSAVSPTSESNGFTGDGCTLSVPSPPTKTGDAVGVFCLAQNFSVNTSTINDNGPNNGYSYVTSVSNQNGSATTGYFYVISPDLENTSSTFYKSQCGNYNAQTNPNGFISGSNLLTDATRHESGTIQSHYENYVVAQDTPSYNLGTVAEGMTGLESAQTLANTVTTTLNQNVNSILSATQVEPCSVQENASCTFQGYINFSPYQSCN